MKHPFNALFSMAAKLADSIIKGNKIDNFDIDKILDKKDRQYIIEHLTDPDILEEREIRKQRIDGAKEWSKLLNSIEPKTRVWHLRILWRAAAIFIGLIGLTYFYVEGNLFSEEPKLESKDGAITLKLETGAVEELTVFGEKKIVDGTGRVMGIQKEGRLSYMGLERTDGSKDGSLVYNELTVPYGKTFELVLSDGTRVHLNAGSSLKYPVKFLKGKNRKVFLKGEAFFDVVKGREPFIANTNTLNVKVLGTEFVISSFPGDSHINTVLVEGSVGIYADGEEFNIEKHTLLAPGFKAAWNKTAEDISIEEVDTGIYTAWLKGRIVFSRMPFKDILKKLERRYNVAIINNNEQLGEEVFTASFDIETIEQILTSFSKNYAFNFQVKNNRITID